ncbi:CHAT domain-containing protein [Hypomontagnella submonticulosa]|nr:CHAT domain-containing protein [Hypomontagnella submonticulosa]
MPEVEDISPPEIPRNSPSSSVADRAENQARSPDKDSNMRAGNEESSQSSLTAENSTRSRAYSGSTSDTPTPLTSHATEGVSMIASTSKDTTGSQQLAMKPQDSFDKADGSTEVSRPSQTRTSIHHSNRVFEKEWMELFDIEEEITCSLHNMNDKDLRDYSLVYEDSTDEKHIELQIYTCFLIFERTRSIEHLQQAVQLASRWSATLAIDHPDRTRRCQISDMMLAWKLQVSLMQEHIMFSQSENTSRAFTSDATADPFHQAFLLFRSYEQDGVLDKLREAIRITTELVNENPLNSALGNLATMLVRLFERTHSMDDLDRAIEVTNTAVDLVPRGHPNENQCLSNLGAVLLARFKRLGSMEDLNRAIDTMETLVNNAPAPHPFRYMYLNNLGSAVGMRFHREGSMVDLDRAIDVSKKALGSIPKSHSDRANVLNTLGDLIGQRFKRTGLTDDLNRAIDTLSEAVDTTPKDHPFRVGYLHNLGIWLGRRFRRERSLDDLNRAIYVADMAASTVAQDHSDRPISLITLGAFLGWRFLRTGSMEDLNRAIDIADIAVKMTTEDHSSRPLLLNNLATLLGKRFQRGGKIDDIKSAITAANSAVQTTDDTDISRATRLYNLGDLYGHQFENTGLVDDLNHAIDNTNMAVNVIPQDDPERASFLESLGVHLSWRSRRTGSEDDLQRALSYFKEGWNCHTAPPSRRISLAGRAGNILALQSNWTEAAQLLREAVTLLPTVNPRSLKHTDKQDTLTEFAGLASMAAATSLNEAGDDEAEKAYRALKLLELGRGIIASVLMDMRTDISDLEYKHPMLAEEFVSLRDELDSPADRLLPLSISDDATSLESQAQRRREADQRFSKLIETIRKKSGFSNFLLPPTKDELMAAANPDPIVVVNVSPYRCDAFIVESHRIRVLELSSLNFDEIRKQTWELRSNRFANMTPTLKWLWKDICRPCLDALGFMDPKTIDESPHMWWIPTGLLSQLPLHAAGCDLQGSTETVLDRVISSYASSIKTLVHGRRRYLDNTTHPPSDQAVLVAMHTTPGLRNGGVLSFAREEVSMLKTLCPSLQLRPIEPTVRKNDILECLNKCKVFHFAGHGKSNPMEPSQSSLLLNDWETNPLTVGDLRDHRLQDNPPFLGYLSACSTGSNEAEDLADESIHLISALQLAGFRHVVGTLWEVSDEHCVHVARVLYETLRDEGMTDISVSRGLHRAIKGLRDNGIQRGTQERNGIWVNSKVKAERQPGFYWVPYIHFGV